MATILNLPWLMRPDAPARATLKDLRGHAPVTLDVLRRIAAFAWDEHDAARLGRIAAAAFGSCDTTALEAAGLAPVRVALLSTRAAVHLAPGLVAAALRHDLAAIVHVDEHLAGGALDRARTEALTSFAPDIVVIDPVVSHVPAVTPGDAAGEDRAVEAAAESVAATVATARVASAPTIIVATLATDPASSQANMDAWLPGSARRVLHRINERLVETTRALDALVFDVAALAETVGSERWAAGRFDYLARFPFAPACVPLYCARLASLIAVARGRSHRALVLDLDGTLWGGIVGDSGIEDLALGPDTAAGVAHLALHRFALRCRERGVFLCLASKNEESIALDAMRRHPAMLLKPEHFAAFRIDWRDKVSNIRDMAADLGLGCGAFVVLDDDPIERRRIRSALPEVAVPELPLDIADWLPLIEGAAFFDDVAFTAEDRLRVGRAQAQGRSPSPSAPTADSDAFLASLDMRLTFAPFDAAGRPRIAQLFAKSNQFNLTTRRYDAAAIAALWDDPRAFTRQVRLTDVAGEAGTISLVVCRIADADWIIEAWVMSCRVLGRRIEEAVLAHIAEAARAAGASVLIGQYRPTARNGLVRDHYTRLGFAAFGEQADGTRVFRLDLADFVAPTLPFSIDA